MSLPRVIPSLLLRQQRLVKGVAFADHRDAGHPVTTARAHNAQGADELLLIDIDASREGRGPDLATIELVAKECFMPLCAGGGIRSVADAKAVIDAGADKILVNSAALDRPALLGEIAGVFGAQAVVLAIDVVKEPDGYRVHDHRSGTATARDPFTWAREAVASGAGEIRLCRVESEGRRTGLDLDLLGQLRPLVSVPIIIEGGAGGLSDVSAGLDAGADAVALGTLLVFSDNNLVKIRRYIAGTGRKVRL